jgi:hypothetical protein
LVVYAPAAAEVDAAAAQVAEMATLDQVVGTARGQPDRVGAGMAISQSTKLAWRSPGGLDQSRLIDFALARIAQPLQVRVGVPEGDAAEMQVLDVLSLAGSPAISTSVEVTTGAIASTVSGVSPGSG